MPSAALQANGRPRRSTGRRVFPELHVQTTASSGRQCQESWPGTLRCSSRSCSRMPCGVGASCVACSWPSAKNSDDGLPSCHLVFSHSRLRKVEKMGYADAKADCDESGLVRTSTPRASCRSRLLIKILKINRPNSLASSSATTACMAKHLKDFSVVAGLPFFNK